MYIIIPHSRCWQFFQPYFTNCITIPLAFYFLRAYHHHIPYENNHLQSLITRKSSTIVMILIQIFFSVRVFFFSYTHTHTYTYTHKLMRFLIRKFSKIFEIPWNEKHKDITFVVIPLPQYYYIICFRTQFKIQNEHLTYPV